MISYNNKKLKELLASLRKNRSDFRSDIGIQNDSTVKRWIEGEDIYVSRLTQICNMYDKNILDFFLIDGQEIKQEEIMQEAEQTSVPDDIATILLKKEKEISEIKLLCKEEIFIVKEELHKQEINHVKEIAELTIRLKDEERTHLYAQHEQDNLSFKKDLEELRTKMEQVISEKDKENSLLQQKLNDIQLQFKELEMSMGTSSPMYKPIAVAEPSQYKKTRK